jgi:hypothetical protein
MYKIEYEEYRYGQKELVKKLGLSGKLYQIRIANDGDVVISMKMNQETI